MEASQMNLFGGGGGEVQLPLITADTAKLEVAITKMSALENLFKTISTAAEGMGTKIAASWSFSSILEGIGGAVTKAFTPAAVVQFAGALLEAAGAAATAQNAIHDLSGVTGVATEDLSVMKVAAEQNGMSFDAFGGTINKMMGNVHQALGGNKELAAAFGAVGVSVEELRTRSPRDLMLEIANGLQGIEDPSMRVAAANTLLGSSSTALLGTLETLSGDGFARVAEEAGNMGLIVSGSAAESADEFYKNLSKLGSVLMGLVNTLVSSLMPVINMLIDSLGVGAGGWLSWLNPIGQLTLAIKAIGTILAATVGVITSVFNQVKTYFTQIGAFFDAFMKKEWGKAADIAGNFTKVQGQQWNKDWDKTFGNIEGIWSPQSGQAEAANRPVAPPPAVTPPPPPPAPKVDEQAIARNKELLETAEKQITALGRQLQLVGDIDAVDKGRITTNHKLQEINEKYADKIKDIPSSMSKADQARLKSLYEQAEAMEKTKVTAEHEEAENRLLKSREKSRDAALRSAEEAERTGVAAARNAELEQLRSDKLKTSADIERIAKLERDAAMDAYNAKIDEAHNKAKAATEALGPKPDTGAALVIWQAHFDAIVREEKAIVTNATAQHEREKTRIALEENAGKLAAQKTFLGNAHLEELAMERRKELDKGTQAGIEQAAQIEARLDKEKEAHQEMVNQFGTYATAMGTGVKNAIINGLEKGNFADAMKGIVDAFDTLWKGALDKILTKFFTDLGTIASGKPLEDKDSALAGMKPSTAKGIMGGMAALAIGMDAYSQGATPGGRTAATMGGAMSGAMYGWQLSGGNPIGAVVGAVVGAIVGAIGAAMGAAAAREDYKYGIPQIDKKGNVTWSKLDDLSQGEIDSYTAKIGATYREFWNGYTNILLKLPGSDLPTPKPITGKFQDEASKHYLKHLNEWLENKLPKDIADQFKSGMSQAFQAAGVGAQAFDAFWAEAQKMDPKKALQFWNDLTEGLVAFDKAASTRQNIADLNGNWADAQFLADGTNRKPNESEFHADLRTKTQPIFDIARQMIHLAGPERAAAWKNLGQNVQQVMGSLTDYLNQVGEAMRSVKDTIENTKFEWELENLKDAEGNVDKTALIVALDEQLDKVMAKIAGAAEAGLSPADVEKLVQQAIQLTDRIYQVDPEQVGNDFRILKLAEIEEAANASLAKMAEHAQSAVDKLMAEIEPFKDWFLELTKPDIPAAMADLENAFPGFKQAILELQEVIGGTAVTANAVAVTTETNGSDDGDNGGQGFTNNVVDIAAYVEQTKRLNERLVEIEARRAQAEQERAARGQQTETPINVTVNVNGAMVGIQELQTNVTRAAVAGVVEAIRNQPTIIEHPFALGG